MKNWVYDIIFGRKILECIVLWEKLYTSTKQLKHIFWTFTGKQEPSMKWICQVENGLYVVTLEKSKQTKRMKEKCQKMLVLSVLAWSYLFKAAKGSKCWKLHHIPKDYIHCWDCTSLAIIWAMWRDTKAHIFKVEQLPSTSIISTSTPDWLCFTSVLVNSTLFYFAFAYVCFPPQQTYLIYIGWSTSLPSSPSPKK